jgi:5'-3' exonuclease
MSTDKKYEYIKLLDALSETFGESDEQTPDEIRDELREEGFDIDSVETELMKFQQEISMAAKRQTLDEAKSRREKLVAKQQEIINNIKNWTKEQVLERFKDILSNEPDPVVAYRDLEAKKDEDMKAILVDLELTRLAAEEDENGSE